MTICVMCKHVDSYWEIHRHYCKILTIDPVEGRKHRPRCYDKNKGDCPDFEPKDGNAPTVEEPDEIN